MMRFLRGLGALQQAGAIIILALSLWGAYEAFFVVHDKKVINEHEEVVQKDIDKKVKQNENDIDQTYSTPASDAISDSVKRLLEPSAEYPPELQSTRKNPADAEDFGGGRINLGAQDGLPIIRIGEEPEEPQPLPRIRPLKCRIEYGFDADYNIIQIRLCD